MSISYQVLCQILSPQVDFRGETMIEQKSQYYNVINAVAREYYLLW